MLNSLRPPTDNLYKFVAIFGLLVAAFGVWSVISDINRLFDERYGVYEAYQEAWFAADESSDLRVLLDEKIEDRDSWHALFGLSDQARQFEGVEPDTIDAVRGFEMAATRAAYLDSKLQAYTEFFGYVIGLGLVMVIVGFWKWYWKVQMYENIILEERAIGSQSVSPKKPRTARYRQRRNR